MKENIHQNRENPSLVKCIVSLTVCVYTAILFAGLVTWQHYPEYNFGARLEWLFNVLHFAVVQYYYLVVTEIEASVLIGAGSTTPYVDWITHVLVYHSGRAFLFLYYAGVGVTYFYGLWYIASYFRREGTCLERWGSLFKESLWRCSINYAILGVRFWSRVKYRF